MITCPNCKKELEEGVAFCSECGCKIEPVAPVAEVVAEPIAPVVEPVAPVAEAKKESPLFVILNFVSKIATIVSAFFGAVAIAAPSIRVSTSISKYTGKISAYAYFEPEEACAIFALLMAIAAVALAVFLFVMCLVKKANLKNKFENIASLTLNTLLFIFTIVLVSNI